MSSQDVQGPVVIESRNAETPACNRVDAIECPDCGAMAVQRCGRCATCHCCGWSVCSR